MAEELFHCGFEGVNITFTSDIKEALTGAKYIVNSGGAARKAGMTREDLLKGNAAIAEEFGKNVKAYCPECQAYRSYFQSGRYHRFDHTVVFRFETFAGDDFGCFGLYPPA